MNTHTSVHSKRLALGRAISQRSKEIIRRWLELVQQGLKNRQVDAADLEDGLEGYLQGIASAFGKPVTSLEHDGGALWLRVAQEHATTRLSLGFDISQLVEEFTILRRVLFDVARDEGLFSGEQAVTIGEFISAAVVAAVQSYVDARDYPGEAFGGRARRFHHARASKPSHHGTGRRHGPLLPRGRRSTTRAPRAQSPSDRGAHFRMSCSPNVFRREASSRSSSIPLSVTSFPTRSPLRRSRRARRDSPVS